MKIREEPQAFFKLFLNLKEVEEENLSLKDARKLCPKKLFYYKK
jgi:hypothetical protein